ncbi:MAG: Spy/CpxP family protein refolding chaperone [Fibrobacteraceae bacterium]|nr:Spy/CpxP family protein refolding chaperone [Fibrobacteraceae bacterium]
MALNSSSKLFLASGLILAASVGFFASSVFFNHSPRPFDNRGPAQEEMQVPREENTARQDGPLPSKRDIDSILGLSKDQIAKLDSNVKACDSTRKALHQKIRMTERKLHDVLDQNPISEADLKSVRAELLLLNEERLDLRIADIKRFKAVLTPEQNKKLKALQPKFENKYQNKGKNKLGSEGRGNRDGKYFRDDEHRFMQDKGFKPQGEMYRGDPQRGPDGQMPPPNGMEENNNNPPPPPTR